MTLFSYLRPASLHDALLALREPATMPIAGGTDLLVNIQEGLAHPDRVVDVRDLAESRGITELADSALRIGGATRLTDLAEHPLVAARYPMLASACEQVGTPAIRAMATIAGNLNQRPRCWYFRRNISCHKTRGDSCPAVEGENHYLAIVEGGPCHIVHPSDPAVALVALEAVFEIAGSAGRREVDASDFFVLPTQRMDRETVLADDELLVAIRLPAESAGGAQRYVKLMQREAWDFALVSLASAKRRDGEVRLVLGGVSPRPYRVYGSIEEETAGGRLDEETISVLADRALLDAVPLSKNEYKLTLAATLLRDAITELASE